MFKVLKWFIGGIIRGYRPRMSADGKSMHLGKLDKTSIEKGYNL